VLEGKGAGYSEVVDGVGGEVGEGDGEVFGD
jgi:hypothetical protein